MSDNAEVYNALSAVEDELLRAIAKHGAFVDYHHGLGVLQEEVHELFLEIIRRDDQQIPLKISAEAIQVAAVACKLAILASGRAKEARG